ncbi:hypothetical protein SEA_WEASELS2_244 [Rhodococcus phage Weasels2]|uniref:Uncharacterized protein n=1 Tax=Rhodococcus phage Weasels2 TaxID=1897437 RepID=A0A1I9SAL6_9CAUD|nr:hypothetical protein FDH04_gp172 [Rhodococcus phage Weasels2]AOZ63822.1 hypothetical protein SEA_WEASELS2_244 [Rhodococcus phage Weasels2]
MSDYYEQMMHYHYAHIQKHDTEQIAVEYFRNEIMRDPGLTMAQAVRKLKKFDDDCANLKKHGYYSDYLQILVDYMNLVRPKKSLLDIYPETLQRCTRSIND